jgi:hypothetical protein
MEQPAALMSPGIALLVWKGNRGAVGQSDAQQH